MIITLSLPPHPPHTFRWRCGNSEDSAEWAARKPGKGLTLPLSVTAASSPAGKLGQKGHQMGPQRNIIKGLFVSECIGAEEGNVMHGTCMDGFSTHPSPNLIFSLGERKVAGEKAKRPRRCQHSSGKGPPLEWARWQRHGAEEWILKMLWWVRHWDLFLKWKIYENNLV